MRSADPACNPYLAITLLLSAALEGIRGGNLPPLEEEYQGGSAYQKQTGRMLPPSSLAEAMELAKHSDFVRSIIPPDRLLTCFLDAKGAEWRSYETAVDPFEASRKAYFLTT